MKRSVLQKFIVLLVLAFAWVRVTALTVVVAPPTGDGLSSEDAGLLGHILESETSRVLADDGRYTLVNRGAWNKLQMLLGRGPLIWDEQTKARLRNQKEVALLLESNLERLAGGQFHASLALLDTQTGEPMPGTTVSDNSRSMEEMQNMLPKLVSRCFASAHGMRMTAILPPVVTAPECLEIAPKVLQEMLSDRLLKRGVRLAVQWDVEKAFQANSLDISQSLLPEQYQLMAQQLHTGYLVMPQLAACSLRQEEIAGGPLQRELVGSISVSCKVVDQNGRVLALPSCEREYPFHSMAMRGMVHTVGWSERQFCDFMVSRVLDEIVPGILKELK